MNRSSLTSSFLTIFTLLFVYLPAATADPVVTTAFVRVMGFTDIPAFDGTPTSTTDNSVATSGSFVGNVANGETGTDASASYTADIATFLSPFLMEASGSTFSTITTASPASARAYADAFHHVTFTLDGNYDYSFSGFLSASNGNARVQLSSFISTFASSQTTDGLLVPFSFSGTLGAGDYFLQYAAVTDQSQFGFMEGSAAFGDVTFSLAPAAATVPDGGDTAILFLFGSALLCAFALRERRQAP